MSEETTGPDQAWEDLVDHAAWLESGRPGKRWRKEADALLEQLPADTFRERLVDVLLDALADDSIRDERGLLVLASATGPDEPLLAGLGSVAEHCFQRVPDRGPRDLASGNICLKALASFGAGGAAQLEALFARVHYPSIRERIEAALAQIANDLGVSRTDLTELAIPDHGLDREGMRRIEVDGGAAELQLTSAGTVDVRWFAPSGRAQKSPPAALRRTAPHRVRNVGTVAQEIRRMVAAQRRRIELSLRDERSWEYAAWRVRYMEHPIVAPVARRLIWRLDTADGPTLAIDWKRTLVDAAGDPVKPRLNGRISLWHPLESGERTVRAWRAFVEEHGLRQPFRQAHRETFHYDSGEDGPDEQRSTRFGGHVVRQQQFAALCRSRDWDYTLQGRYDLFGGGTRVELPRHGLVATLVVPQLESYDPDYGIDPFVTIDALRFLSGTHATVALREVPPRLFSEIMRDVSLFVGVATVANTPAWRDAPAPLRRYYREAIFSELSEAGRVRRDFLERRRQDLPHSDRLSLDDRALVVRGDLHTYRLHLDTGQVLMAPDGPLLSIPEQVGPRTRPELEALLPFEDATLSLIMATVALLARDSEIDDAFVRVQL